MGGGDGLDKTRRPVYYKGVNGYEELTMSEFTQVVFAITAPAFVLICYYGLLDVVSMISPRIAPTRTQSGRKISGPVPVRAQIARMQVLP